MRVLAVCCKWQVKRPAIQCGYQRICDNEWSKLIIGVYIHRGKHIHAIVWRYFQVGNIITRKAIYIKVKIGISPIL